MRHGFSVAIVVLLCACSSEPVGGLCDLGDQPPRANEVMITTSSLDCVSRTCLRVPLSAELPAGSEFPTGTTGLCTTQCESDDDCEGVAGSPCVGGFACAVAVPVGDACCKKFCVCKDYGVPPEPAACDPDVATNTCANLPGRS